MSRMCALSAYSKVGDASMKIVVIGGSGLIGTKVVKKLTEQGHAALAASPNTGADTTTGRGLAEALARAKVVVDVSNSPSFEDVAVLAFFENSGRNLARVAVASSATVKPWNGVKAANAFGPE